MCIGMTVTSLQKCNTLVLGVKLFNFKYALKSQTWQLNGTLIILLDVGILSKCTIMLSCVGYESC